MASSSDMLEVKVSAHTTIVQVKWCGIDHHVHVQPGENIGELKRRFEQDTGLPAKRQRHMMPNTDDELGDGYLLSSLTSPPTTDLIGLNKPDDELYRRCYYYDDPERRCYAKNNQIRKRKKEYLSDFHGTDTAFFRGTYTVGSHTTSCLLKQYGAKEKVLPSLRLMSTWRHPNLLVLRNIYKVHPYYRLVVFSSSFDGTLNGWLSHGQDNKILNPDGTFTPIFSRIILDLCDILDKMINRQICPTGLTIDNLYLKTVNGQPQLRAFFDDVEHVAFKTPDQLEKIYIKLCADMKKIMTSDVSTQMHIGTRAYCDFIERHGPGHIGQNLAKLANFYPIKWTDEEKSKYLIAIYSSNQDFSRSINQCGISFLGQDVSQDIKKLEGLVYKANKEKEKRRQELSAQGAAGQAEAEKIRDITWNYNIEFPNDIVRLARNLWKHYNSYPRYIKDYLGGSQNAVLRKLEFWCPNVWILIYNAVGIV